MNIISFIYIFFYLICCTKDFMFAKILSRFSDIGKITNNIPLAGYLSAPGSRRRFSAPAKPTATASAASSQVTGLPSTSATAALVCYVVYRNSTCSFSEISTQKCPLRHCFFCWTRTPVASMAM